MTFKIKNPRLRFLAKLMAEGVLLFALAGGTYILGCLVEPSYVRISPLLHRYGLAFADHAGLRFLLGLSVVAIFAMGLLVDSLMRKLFEER